MIKAKVIPRALPALLAIGLSSCTQSGDYASLRDPSCAPAPGSATVGRAIRSGDYDLGYPRGTVEQLAIRGMLRSRRYGALDTLLTAYGDSARQDFHLEYRLLDAYDAFDVADRSLEPLLDEFALLFQNSAAARFARATYYIESAWHARGAKSGSETSREQFVRTREYFQMALADIAAGQKLAPCSFIAFYLAMRTTAAFREQAASRAYLDQGLTVYPSSFLLRSMHMYNLVPRWGGSYAEMERFASESDGLWDQNARLIALHGFAAWDRGRVYWARGDTSRAVAEYEKALTFGDLWQFRLELGKLNYRTDDYREALSNLNRALAQHPQDVEALRFRARTHYALGRRARGADRARFYSAAFADIDRAARLDPLDERVQQSREFYKEQIPEFAPRGR